MEPSEHTLKIAPKIPDELVFRVTEHVKLCANKPSFMHHSWYVKYHLDIVEQIALELCELYTHANKNLVLLLVWLHDYGKITHNEMHLGCNAQRCKEYLTELTLPPQLITVVCEYIQIIDAKENLVDPTTPIEIQIVSSADGAPHFFGPFYQVWCHENPDKPLSELLKSNIAKATKDWDKKIVLPQISELVRERYELIREQNGELPTKYLNS